MISNHSDPATSSSSRPTAAGLIDELRLHLAPAIIGAGERLLDGLGSLDLEPLDVTHTGLVTHLTYRVPR